MDLENNAYLPKIFTSWKVDDTKLTPHLPERFYYATANCLHFFP